jgi:hypothetical protein
MPMNAPFDLGDPLVTSQEISPDEFERAWKRATSAKEEGSGPREQADRKARSAGVLVPAAAGDLRCWESGLA